MKSPKIIGIIFVLVVFNILLLYTNFKQQNQISTLTEKIRLSKFGRIVNGNAKIINPEVRWSDTGVSLLIFFTDQGCEGCIENEVRNINSLTAKHNPYLRVYMLGENATYLKRYHPNFSFETIPTDIPILDTELSITNPVAVLVDSRGIVQSVHTAEVGNPGISNRFYHRMHSLFESL